MLFLAICLLCALTGLAVVVLVRKSLESRIEHKAAKRGLYLFNDGKRMRCVDPIVVLTEMENHKEFRFDRHPQEVQDGESEAQRILIDATRKAFGVPAFTSPKLPGLTEKETMKLFWHFCGWVESQKKNSKSAVT